MSEPPGPLVRLDGVTKSYRTGADERTVLRDVTLVLDRGEVVSVTGASGSGKSTLVSLLAGLTLPDEGLIAFDGRDVAALDDTDRARVRGRRIGIVLQSGTLIPFLTAQQNVELAVELGDGDRGGTGAASALGELGLGDRLHHLPRRLSGGEAQRVAVAIALANAPDLLLADEVTGQLDTANANEVMDAIFDAWRARGLTVLYVTHNEELATRAGRRLVVTDGSVHER